MQNFQIDWSIVTTIAAPIMALIAGYTLERYFGSKPNVIAYLGHMANFVVKGKNEKQNETPVYTHSVVVRNTGKQSAKNIRIGHHALPPDYTITPTIKFKIESVSKNGKEIMFPTLVPGEQVTISYLYFSRVSVDDIHSYIKSDDGMAKIIRVIPQQLFSKWIYYLSASFSLIGIVTIIYAIYVFMR